MDELPQVLSELWDIPEAERTKGLDLLSKIFTNILNNPAEEKYTNINFQKIQKKFETCSPCLNLLFTVGFNKSTNNLRIKWIYNDTAIKTLKSVNNILKYYFDSEYKKIINQMIDFDFNIVDVVEAIDAIPDNKNIYEIMEYVTDKQQKIDNDLISNSPNIESKSNVFKDNDKQLDEEKMNNTKLTEKKLEIIKKMCNLKQIDFKVFENPSANINCTSSKHHKLPISECQALKRLYLGLAYKELLCDDDNKIDPDKQDLFVTLNVEVYKNLLNDWIHFMEQHTTNEQLMQIADELRNNYNIKKCSVNECKSMRRHYTRRSQINDEDGIYGFYVECYDRFHHQVFHLFDLGLRAQPKDEWKCEICTFINTFDSKLCKMCQSDKSIWICSKCTSRNNLSAKRCEMCDEKRSVGLEDESKDESDFDFKCVDEQFKKQRDIIQKVRKINISDFERYNEENNKFTLNVDTHYKQINDSETGSTCLDQFYLCLLKNQNLAKFQIKELQQYVIENEYDTDAVECDLDDAMENESKISSNICKNINEPSLFISSFKKHMRNIKLLSNSFSTGFMFFYEAVYYNAQRISGDMFDGYSPSELLVLPAYDTLKQEILESEFLTLAQWNDKVVLIGGEYHNTKKAKTIAMELKNNYTVSEQTYTMELSQIYCVILYCNFTDLCTHFSGTYRKTYPFEPIKSVTSRHSKYYHFGKGLKSAVHMFGVSGNPNVNGNQFGPFYCGLSYVLNIPSFAIYLKGPCSTSVVLEIAVNFATRSGIIIELQNDKGRSSSQPCFDCSWISNYAEEMERLFVAAERRLRVKSIRIIETAQNFKQYMHALYVLDAMISGVQPGNLKGKHATSVLRSDVTILNKLIDSKLENVQEIDPYIIDTFQLFLNTKTKIEINIHFLATTFNEISKLLMDRIVRTDKDERVGLEAHPMFQQKFNEYANWRSHLAVEPGNDTQNNILNVGILDIFPNIEQVVIDTTYSDWYTMVLHHEYKFDFLSFLSSIKQAKSSIKYVIKASPKYSMYPMGLVKESWLSNGVDSSINEMFSKNKWNIKYTKKYITHGITIGQHKKVDYLTIDKRNY